MGEKWLALQPPEGGDQDVSALGACLIFLHLPKTGGSTLTTLLRWQYRKLHPSEILQFVTRKNSLEEVGSIPLEQRARLKVLMGHFAYGVHDYMPQECGYITVVREPAQRILSTYRYVLSYPGHSLHEKMTTSSMTVDDYIVSGIHHYQTENAMTRQLAGRDEEGELTARDLELAKENLKGFLAIGLTEAFDESLILFKRILGWGIPFYFSRNVSAKGPRQGQISDDTIELIRERNGFDLELYGLARSLFRSIQERHGEGFDREVKTFKLLNRVPQTLGAIAEPLAPQARRLLEGRAARRST